MREAGVVISGLKLLDGAVEKLLRRATSPLASLAARARLLEPPKEEERPVPEAPPPAFLKDSLVFRLSGLGPFLVVVALSLLPFLSYRHLAAVFALVALLTLGRWQRAELKDLFSRGYFRCLSALVLVFFLSSFPTFNLKESFSFFGTTFLCGYLMCALVFLNLRRKGHFEWLEAGIIASSYVLGILGVYQYLHYPFYNPQWINVDAYTSSFMARRVYATFENPNAYAQYLVVTLALLVSFGCAEKRSSLHLAALGAAVLLGVNLGLTFSRGGYLGAAAALFLLFFLYKQSFLVYGLGLLCLAWPFLPSDFTRRLLSPFFPHEAYDASVSYRAYAWLAGIRMTKKYFLAGIGTGQENFLRFYANEVTNNIQVYHLHNTFLQVLLTCGVLGFLALLAVVLYNLRFFTLAYGLREDSAQRLRLAFLAGTSCGLLGLWVTGLAEDVFRLAEVYLTFWLYSGVLLAASAGAAFSSGRVALVGVYPPPSGGISIHIKRLCDRLDRHRISYQIYDIREGEKDRPTVFVPEEKVVTWALKYFFTCGEDVVHVHLHSWTVRFLLSLLRLRGKLVLFTVHSLRDAPERDRPLKRLLYRLTGLLGHKFLAVTDSLREELARYGIPEGKIEVVPAFIPPGEGEGGVPGEILSFLKEGEIKIVSYAQDVTYFAGQEVYGLEDCVAFAACLQQHGFSFRFAFILTNLREEERLRDIEEQIARARLGDSFRIFRADVNFAALLKEADFYVRANRFDGDSLAVREAIFLGKKVLCSDAAPRPPEVFLFRKGDVSDMYRAFLKAVEEEREPRAADFSEQIIALYRSYLG